MKFSSIYTLYEINMIIIYHSNPCLFIFFTLSHTLSFYVLRIPGAECVCPFDNYSLSLSLSNTLSENVKAPLTEF